MIITCLQSISRQGSRRCLAFTLACVLWAPGSWAFFTLGSSEAAQAKYLDGNDGKDWPGAGRTYGERHYSPLSEIDKDSVSRLGLAWSVDLAPGYSVTQPIAVEGILYFASGQGVLNAVDIRTGKQIWTYDPEVWKGDQIKLRTAWGSRGVAWWDGNIFIGTLDGRLISIDARTGKQNWSVQTTRKGDGQFITGAPRAFDGKVIIGNGGADSAPTRGYVTAYDAEDGTQLWRFFIVPGDPADGVATRQLHPTLRRQPLPHTAHLRSDRAADLRLRCPGGAALGVRRCCLFLPHHARTIC